MKGWLESMWRTSLPAAMKNISTGTLPCVLVALLFYPIVGALGMKPPTSFLLSKAPSKSGYWGLNTSLFGFSRYEGRMLGRVSLFLLNESDAYKVCHDHCGNEGLARRVNSGEVEPLWDNCQHPGQHKMARDIVFVVLSQSGTDYNEQQARQLRNDIHAQAQILSQKRPVVHLTHEDFPHPGAWTIFPLLSRLNSLHGSNCSWIVLCESYTNFNLSALINLLAKYDETKEVWIGHELYDREPTIIHHFAFFDDPQKFKYPFIATGVVFSKILIARLASRLKDRKQSDADFSIDISHELSLFVQNDQQGPFLEHSEYLCLNKEPHCASYIAHFEPCSEPVPKDSIYFAVKTFSKFHKDRVPVVKSTWAKHAMHIGYFSDIEDVSVPTISVGIPNAEHGHCSKTLAILKKLATLPDSLPEVKWVVIVDDDTIISVSRLRQLLSCFGGEKLLALGERYGYNVQYSRHGYNYITGGGGMVFSIDVVVKLVNSGQCVCPSHTTPDDMYLGVCLTRLGIKVTHSPSFHQARPVDYAPEYLSPQFPVSFHKHWMINPVTVYQDWFEEADKHFDTLEMSHQHTEL